MEERVYDALRERVLWGQLENGLTVAIVPRPGFTRKLCYFATDYGSVHRCFTQDTKAYTAPQGVAHYLEHKLFDMPGRDITAEFAALGAVPNAFTSYDMTAYHFSCTENFEASLRLLLEFVSTAYFTAESVQKEQGIIGQEIDMNADTPETRVFEQLMQAMYRNHPIKEPILGTRESIAQITPEVLARCHSAFYCPGNMLLCVIGDVDAQQVEAIARELLPTQPAAPGQAVRAWPEEMTCRQAYVVSSMEVSMPMFQLGFKCEPAQRGEEAVRQEVIGDLAAEALFGESSELYLRLYEDSIIDASFGGGFETVEGMAMLTAAGDSDEPETVQDAILRQAKVIAEQGIGEADFLRMKRSALGRRIRGLDSFDSTCFRICAYHFSGFDYYRFPAVYRDVTSKEIQEFLQRVVTEDRMCLSVIQPCEEV